jgi:hypothetical protein
MAAKRRPGAGRPAKRGPTRSLTVRLPESTRDELQAAAKAHGCNLTEELLWRVRNSKDRDKTRNPAMRALCFLFSEIGEAVHSNVPDWRANPFLYRAFRLAVAKLLDELAPPGKTDKPPDSFLAFWKDASKDGRVTEKFVGRRLDSPDSLAEQAAANVLWSYASETYLTNPAWEDAMRVLDIDAEGMSARLRNSLKRSFYGMADARRDLAIKPQRKK